MGKALESFVRALYDDSHAIGSRVAKHFGVSAFPTLLVLDADGGELDEVNGRTPEEFVKELKRIERGEDTMASLRARLKSNPRDVEAAADLAGRLYMRRPEEAERLATEGLTHASADQTEERADLMLIRASLLAERGSLGAALDLLEQVLVELPQTKAAGNVGYVMSNYAYEGEPSRMLPLLERAIEVAPEEVRGDLLGTRVRLHERNLQALIRAQAERAHDDGEWLNRIAWDCYVRGWLLTDALAWAHRAVELTERAPHVLDTLACLLFKSGKLDAAIRIQAEALLGVEDEAMRADFEENMATFYAVKRLRDRRGDESR